MSLRVVAAGRALLGGPSPGRQVMARGRHRWLSSPSSDRLMGYSPMAPSGPLSTTPGAAGSIPTAHDVTTSGGVWAPTSSKREKLTELKAALAETIKSRTQQDLGPFDATLSDLATDAEKLDLWLVDGLEAVAKAADATTLGDNDDDDDNAAATEDSSSVVWPQIRQWMTDAYKEVEKDPLLTQQQYEDYLRRFLREVERHLAFQTSEFPDLMRSVRDYVDVQSHMEQLESPPPPETLTERKPQHLDIVMERYRLLLAQAAAQVLLDSWKTLTTVSDHDVDRAAVDGQALDQSEAATSARIPIAKVEALLESYLRGSASIRVDAWWSLLDMDHDGLLQEAEMNSVCELAVAPVGKALEAFLTEALEAHPVRVAPVADDASPPSPAPPMGWRQRRQEARHKRRLQKMFAKTIKNHFVDEVEMSHRLRCIYAWANKAHQDNAIKSVVVDEIAWTGRKRYVELPPKISLPEFREVQQEHFTHLDRVATEFLKSFREDLWILQGNGRQRSELIRDCAIFMAVVCGIDYVIIML